ncbi:MAG: hypothetical protein ACLSE7_00910 [Lachnospirales bacterium]
MNKLLRHISEHLATVLLVLGSAAVCVGAGCIFIPAGILTAGFFSLAAGWLLIKGGDGS